ncbi:hypothetical protein Pelo_2998 [Pelomyxa schiedti]|nr:hypothetical protein Pelo_2998 [Pelomyxa schiedti]
MVTFEPTQQQPQLSPAQTAASRPAEDTGTGRVSRGEGEGEGVRQGEGEGKGAGPVFGNMDAGCVARFAKAVASVIQVTSGIPHYRFELRPSESGETFQGNVCYGRNRKPVKHYETCISCVTEGNVVSQNALILETEFSRCWIDAQGRPKIIITPKRHLGSIHELTEPEAIDMFAAVQTVCGSFHMEKLHSIVINNGNYRNHEHLHAKVNMKDFQSSMPKFFQLNPEGISTYIMPQDPNYSNYNNVQYLLVISFRTTKQPLVLSRPSLFGQQIKHQQLQSQIEQYHAKQIPYPLRNTIPMHQQLHEAFGTALGGEYSLPRKHPSTEQYETYQSRPKLAHSPSSGTRPRSSTSSQPLGYSAYPDAQRAFSQTPDKRCMQYPRNLQYNPMLFSNPQAMELVPPHAHQSTHKPQRGQFQQLQPTITAPRRGRPPSLSQLTAQQQQLGMPPFPLQALSLMPLAQSPFSPQAQSPSPPLSPAHSSNTTALSPTSPPPSEGVSDILSPNRSKPTPASSTSALAGTPKTPSVPSSPQLTNSYLFNSPSPPSFFNAIIRSVKMYAQRAEEMDAFERRIIMKAILQVCGLQAQPSESTSILDLVNAVFAKSIQKRGSVQPILAELLHAAFRQVKWAYPKVFSNEFPAPSVDTEGDSSLWGCTARSSMMQLHMLQAWATQLENLPASQKQSIWETCKLIPSFDRDGNQFPSLEGTIAYWATNPLDHQESITTMFSALGYLSQNSMLQTDFFSPATEGCIKKPADTTKGTTDPKKTE